MTITKSLDSTDFHGWKAFTRHFEYLTRLTVRKQIFSHQSITRPWWKLSSCQLKFILKSKGARGHNSRVTCVQALAKQGLRVQSSELVWVQCIMVHFHRHWQPEFWLTFISKHLLTAPPSSVIYEEKLLNMCPARLLLGLCHMQCLNFQTGL